jgi:hypothetical protein
MPFNHLRGRRKRDRLELNLPIIDARCRKLENLPTEMLPYVDAATAAVMDIIGFNGADTFDRADLLMLGMGATLMQQASMRVPPSFQPYLYELVIKTILDRIELLEATR